MLRLPISSDKDYFTHIYRQGIWGQDIPSGISALPSCNKPYLDRLTKILEAYKSTVNKILDFGCGDYSLYSEFNWPSEVTYTGVDIVDDIVRDNTKLYSTSNVTFQVVEDWASLPEADCLLVKDVFTYWNEDQVKRFCKEVVPKYSYVLLTHDLPQEEYLSVLRNQPYFYDEYAYYAPKNVPDMCLTPPASSIEYTYPRYDILSSDVDEILVFDIIKQVLIFKE